MTEEKKGFIYGLYSTRESDWIRYVGQTVSIDGRYQSHKSSSDSSLKSSWVNTEIDSGYEIQIKILEICDVSKMDERERFWIEKLSSNYLYNSDRKTKSKNKRTVRRFEILSLFSKILFFTFLPLFFIYDVSRFLYEFSFQSVLNNFIYTEVFLVISIMIYFLYQRSARFYNA